MSDFLDVLLWGALRIPLWALMLEVRAVIKYRQPSDSPMAFSRVLM